MQSLGTPLQCKKHLSNNESKRNLYRQHPCFCIFQWKKKMKIKYTLVSRARRPLLVSEWKCRSIIWLCVSSKSGLRWTPKKKKKKQRAITSLPPTPIVLKEEDTHTHTHKADNVFCQEMFTTFELYAPVSRSRLLAFGRRLRCRRFIILKTVGRKKRTHQISLMCHRKRKGNKNILYGMLLLLACSCSDHKLYTHSVTVQRGNTCMSSRPIECLTKEAPNTSPSLSEVSLLLVKLQTFFFLNISVPAPLRKKKKFFLNILPHFPTLQKKRGDPNVNRRERINIDTFLREFRYTKKSKITKILIQSCASGHQSIPA